jgi:hypothetical protein
LVNLGAITQGFAARARVRVSSSSGTPLEAPVVNWAAGSDPDLALIHNPCTVELRPGEPCDITLQVVPSRVGGFQGVLELSTSVEKLLVPVSASGLQPGPITLQPVPGGFQDFGGVRVGEVSEATFIVTNPAPSASGPLSFAVNREDFALAPAASGECAPGVTDLGSGQSCNVRLVYAPNGRGAQEAVISVTSLGSGSRSLTLSGQGLVPAQLDVSTALLDFGGVVPGDTRSMELEVVNGGDDPLTLASPQLAPPNVAEFRIAESNCGEGVELAAEQRCRLSLDYRPVQEGQSSAAELLVSAQGGVLTQRIALQGNALTRGNLLVEPLTLGEENFGDVTLGTSATRVFRVSNPTQQPSGGLNLAAHNGFVVDPPAEEGACTPSVTDLGNGQSCTVRVTFTPTARGARAGSLTVDSSLAGAKSLALTGRGISAAALEADTGRAGATVDFGRVTAGSNTSQTLTIRNTGDAPLDPPELRVDASSPDLAAAFTFESGCSLPLANAEECQVVLRFAPQTVVVHTATLGLAAKSGQSESVLLIGEGLAPGVLAVAPAEGTTPDFGDVQVGSSATRSFTVVNPSGVASGALSVLTDNPAFVVLPETCASLGVGGLAGGESCTVSIAFEPTTNVATQARLSIQAAVSGESGVAMTGRGRLVAALAATVTERDLGRANVGQPSGPANQFTWTVNNSGDLPSGALTVSNDNPTDFNVTLDTCSAGTVAGAGSCQLTIVFAPNAAGDRTARISVDETATLRSVPLRVTGFGVQLAAPGQACLATTDCSSGICTGGICCDQECSLTCQSCATGQCLPQNNQEPCGNSGGVCSGVEQCALPAGGDCVDTTQCGGGLLCKTCLDGSRQCAAATACCGGCAEPYDCVNGACACPLQADGLQQLNCGNVCALNRSGACCANSPPAGCNCDPQDNLCKECLDNGDCTNGPPNTFGQCNPNRTCTYACQQGFQSCQDGRCIGLDECCGCGANQDCNGGVCQVRAGATCAVGLTPCATNNCSGGRCCDAGCASGCNAQGSCSCPDGEVFANGACSRPEGASCTGPADCANCRLWYEDRDDDGFGNDAVVRGICGNGAPTGQFPFVQQGGDCCDANEDVRPDQTTPQANPVPGNACPGVLDYDYNCDGRQTYLEDLQETTQVGCSDRFIEDGTPCLERSGISRGRADDGSAVVQTPVFVGGQANLCGSNEVAYIICAFDAAGVCVLGGSAAPPTCL